MSQSCPKRVPAAGTTSRRRRTCAMASRLEFRVLGPLTVRVDGVRSPSGGPKQRALLALLLLGANRVVSRERLIGELFAEQSVNSADHALRNHVSRLREVLGAAAGDEPRLVARPPRIPAARRARRARPRELRAARRGRAGGARGRRCGSRRPARARGGGAVARTAAGRSRVRAVRAGRGGAAGGAPAGGGRGADRRRARARPPPRARRRARGAGAPSTRTASASAPS